jgi:hypothetical protein
MAFTHPAGWQPSSGGILKSVGEGGTYGALCVRFGNEFERDISGEFFDISCEFYFTGPAIKVVSLFNHTIPIATSETAKRFANAVFPPATIERVEGGLFGTITLSPSDPLQSAVAKMIENGALRFSTGSAMQFVRREGARITHWKILELSTTPVPAEPRLPKIRSLN